MIFGFNTDIRHADTIYHVQSEAREHEQALQTQVFVGGHCLGKLTRPYSEDAKRPGADATHESLKDQHRTVLEAIRDGRLIEVLGAEANGHQLSLEWLNSDSIYRDGRVLVQMRVAEATSPVCGAKVIARVSSADQPPYYLDVTSGNDGTAEISFDLAEPAMTSTSILVQASYEDRSVTRKFQLKQG